MNNNILELIGIDISIFDSSLICIFDIIEEMYNKGGIAYLESKDENSDPVIEYLNICIEVIKNGHKTEVTKFLLQLACMDFEYKKICKNDKSKIMILKLLFPYIQNMDLEFIIDFQNSFCSQDTIIKNMARINKYM